MWVCACVRVCVCVCVQPLSCSPGGISVSNLSLQATFYMHVSIHLSMQLECRESSDAYTVFWSGSRIFRCLLISRT